MTEKFLAALPAFAKRTVEPTEARQARAAACFDGREASAQKGSHLGGC